MKLYLCTQDFKQTLQYVKSSHTNYFTVLHYYCTLDIV